ncbi:MAG: DNA polymerase I, partial [Candidatus Pacebacteria bacterium]|nr:DNA polymerase I [Candidatus Paceibacterota bacterium]
MIDVKESSREIFLLVDGHAVIYRAFYAFPKELTTPTGQLINAVYGFSRILLTAIRKFDPVYLAVTFDHPKPSFRREEYQDYKAHRPEMPDDLKPQIKLIKRVVTSLNIPQYEVEGYEADDLIGTISKRLDQDHQVLTIIATGDKDTLQLVDHNTQVWIPGRGRHGQEVLYTPAKVTEKFGITPEQIIDLKALMGDASDNIPGIKGVGKKTATKLLKKFTDLNQLYQAINSHSLTWPQGAMLKKLEQGEEQARLSRKLATIDTKVPLEFSLEACKVSGYDKT